MNAFRFVWDIQKAKINFKKHGVTFEEAQTVFYDNNAQEFYDTAHSQLDEDRFLILGISSILRLLMICHCYRENDHEIRIFSARKATPAEAGFYKNRVK